MQIKPQFVTTIISQKKTPANWEGYGSQNSCSTDGSINSCDHFEMPWIKFTVAEHKHILGSSNSIPTIYNQWKCMHMFMRKKY